MPDLTSLRELTGGVVPPDLDRLAGLVRRRRVRAASVLLATCVAVVALGVALVVPRTGRSAEPVVPPPTSTSSPAALVDEVPLWDSPLQARTVGDTVLEISADGFRTVARHEVRPTWDEAVEVVPFDSERLAVLDPGVGERGRYRLLGAPGTPTVVLRRTDDPVAATPSPANVLVDPILLRVDEAAGTVRPVGPPQRVFGTWGPDVRDHLWVFGFNSCAVHSQQRDGSWHSDVLDCEGENLLTLPYVHAWDEGVPMDFFSFDRLALTEMDQTGHATALHVSLDAGLTWDRIPLAAVDDGTDTYAQAYEVLRSLM